VFAANREETQTSVNFAIGSALASIGLTSPVVTVASFLFGAPLALGIGGATQLQGAVHLVISFVFLGFTVYP
jgi:Ca2+:H+ antiporter